MIFSIIFLLFIAFGFAWVVKDYQKFKKQKETLNKIKNNGKSNNRV
jgi:hypothetical protein